MDSRFRFISILHSMHHALCTMLFALGSSPHAHPSVFATRYFGATHSGTLNHLFSHQISKFPLYLPAFKNKIHN